MANHLYREQLGSLRGSKVMTCICQGSLPKDQI